MTLSRLQTRLFKEENNVIERKGLNYALDFPSVFKTEWVKIVLSRIHENFV